MRDNEEPISLVEAASRSPGRPSANAVWRWCRRGIKSRSGRRVRLDHIRAGGRIYTSNEALKRFFVAVASADAEHFEQHIPEKAIDRTSDHRQSDVGLAEASLEKAGF